MTVLVATHPIFLDHDTGEGHPERPSRMQAVAKGLQTSELGDALVTFEPRPAERDELARIHPINYIDALDRFCRAGGGSLDPDTPVVPASWDAALRAAGAGLESIERLRRGEADAAFCAVRPPGHHATPTRAMGFCLFNNVAVSAAALAAAGERVLIVDYDAHHGNGTQDAFYADPNVLFVSLHQYPLYPGTGGLREQGTGAGLGTTVNFPLPAGATGDVYRRAVDEVVVPLAERWKPTWVLVSAGFDGHRDYADLTREVTQLVPAGRRLVFLEGGYDLWAVVRSTAACLGALAGESIRPEPATSGGPGDEVVDAVARLHLGEA